MNILVNISIAELMIGAHVMPALNSCCMYFVRRCTL